MAKCKALTESAVKGLNTCSMYMYSYSQTVHGRNVDMHNGAKLIPEYFN